MTVMSGYAVEYNEIQGVGKGGALQFQYGPCQNGIRLMVDGQLFQGFLSFSLSFLFFYNKSKSTINAFCIFTLFFFSILLRFKVKLKKYTRSHDEVHMCPVTLNDSLASISA